MTELKEMLSKWLPPRDFCDDQRCADAIGFARTFLPGNGILWDKIAALPPTGGILLISDPTRSDIAALTAALLNRSFRCLRTRPPMKSSSLMWVRGLAAACESWRSSADKALSDAAAAKPLSTRAGEA